MDVKNRTNRLNYETIDSKANSEVSKAEVSVTKAVAQTVGTSRIASIKSESRPAVKAEVNVAGIIQKDLLDRLPSNIANSGKGAIARNIGQRIPGMDKNGLPGGIGRNGFPGTQDIGQRLGIGKTGLGGGLGKPGLPGMPGNSSGIEGLLGDLGRLGLPGGKGKDILGGFGPGGPFGGFGNSGGPAIKMPGSDRMGGASGGSGGSSGFGDPSGLGPGGFGNPGAPSPSGLGGFINGTWDPSPKGGLTGGVSGGGVTWDGYGGGVNDKGQPGLAKGDATGGSVTSPSDATKTSNSSTDKGGAPAGMEWGKHIKNDWVPPAGSEPKKTEGPNDLGPSNNDPAMEQKKENETAVAQNDSTKDTKAGKPDPNAMPNPEDSGGGTPRSIAGSLVAGSIAVA